MHNLNWQQRAACRTEDPALFFGPSGERQPEREVRERMAKFVCARCPVRTDCLDYAVARREEHGVWGGLSEDERRSGRRRLVRAVRARAA